MSEESEDYKWIQSRYEACMNGEISEEEYLKDLDEYKKKLGSQGTEEEKVKSGSSSTSSTRVRSTSIAGLRNKLLEELKKD